VDRQQQQQQQRSRPSALSTLLYAQDGPPGPIAIMLFRGVLQACVLVAAYSFVGKGSSSQQQGPPPSRRWACS
jgi:hypothetical protein